MSLKLFAALGLVCLCASAQAGMRDTNRLGLIASYSVNSQLVGPGIGANATPWFRLEAGYVVPSSNNPRKFNSVLQTNGKFMVSDWDTTPYVGIGSGPQLGQLAFLAGVDYTMASGINIGAGYSKVSQAGASSAVVYGGYYF